MPTVTTSIGYPPQTAQLATGAGTLTSVGVSVPRTYDPRAAVPGRTPYPMDVDLYDGDPAGGGTMLISLSGGDMSGPLSVPFSNGLFIRQRNSNSVSVTFDGTVWVPLQKANTQA